ncbi:ICAM1 protein, partial [Loxia leucoptera]|nr:ICAM1 protein [Loxia leucoptera]
YPTFSQSLSQLFLVLFPPFPGPFPSFSLSPSLLFLVLIPAFPTVKPRLDIERCPPQQNWTEGQEGILTCNATGTPEPQVWCSKDGNSLKPGTRHPADRAHAGTYLCRASSELGTAERNVTVWVQCESGARGLGANWDILGSWGSLDSW